MTPMDLLGGALRQPQRMGEFTLADWHRVIPLARNHGVLGRLAILTADNGLLPTIDERPRRHLESALTLATNVQTLFRWELECITLALAPLKIPVILLKGSAYLLGKLPPMRGRVSGDVDILVPRDALDAVEHALKDRGWEGKPMSPRHAQYFREWLHELPPLVHPYRRIEIDVHHNILPRTDPLAFDAAKLFAAAISASSHSPLKILAPPDMVLHCILHLFRNGRFSNGLRDLLDLDDLLRHFSAQPNFWPQLLARTGELRLWPPLYWGLRYVTRYLAPPIPPDVADESRRHRPFFPPLAIMDWLVEHAILPRYFDRLDERHRWAQWCLEHQPLPRVRVLFTPLFWLKRLPESQPLAKR